MANTIRDVRSIVVQPAGRPLVIVKVETDEPELHGLGCASFFTRPTAVAAAIDDYLKPFLVGKDPADIEDIWQTSQPTGATVQFSTTPSAAWIRRCGISRARWRACRCTSSSAANPGKRRPCTWPATWGVTSPSAKTMCARTSKKASVTSSWADRVLSSRPTQTTT